MSLCISWSMVSNRFIVFLSVSITLFVRLSWLLGDEVAQPIDVVPTRDNDAVVPAINQRPDPFFGCVLHKLDFGTVGFKHEPVTGGVIVEVVLNERVILGELIPVVVVVAILAVLVAASTFGIRLFAAALDADGFAAVGRAVDVDF